MKKSHYCAMPDSTLVEALNLTIDITKLIFMFTIKMDITQ